MADTKISALPSLTTLADADIIPVSQSGTTKGATALIFKTYTGTGGTTSQVTGSDFTTTSTTLVNITGLTFATTANKLYEINSVLKVNGSDAFGLTLGMQYSAAGATHSALYHGASSSQAQSSYANSVFNDPGITWSQTANVPSIITVRAVVTIGANTGNITIQIKKVTSGTATVYIGSRMTVTLLA